MWSRTGCSSGTRIARAWSSSPSAPTRICSGDRPRRHGFLAALAATLALAAFAAVPASAQVVLDRDLDDCVRGVQALQYQSYDLAIHYCSRVIRDGRIPEEARQWALSQRARAYEGKANPGAQADRDRAQQMLVELLYQQALRANPGSAFVYFYLGVTQAIRGAYAEAVPNFTEAIRLQPEFGLTYYNRGLAYLYLGDHDGAAIDFDDAISRLPDFAYAYYNRGYLRFVRGDNAGAVADYSATLRLQPDNADAYNNRGFAYEALGENELAAADFVAAWRLAPDNRRFRAKLIQLGLAR